ncbi:MAG: hypothetical protein Q7K43_06900 [Candidatus Woesearchaeota archaeon]|nr:hypothetical protein [Candidatus Woesearchaeota archaeon]
MRIPKKYGESQLLKCPFCDKRALCKNKQGVPVCASHVQLSLNEMLCSCKSPLELRKGKWGPYFNCIKCGNQNFKRVLEMGQTSSTQQNTETPTTDLRTQTQISKKHTPTEIHITTDDAQWFD